MSHIVSRFPLRNEIHFDGRSVRCYADRPGNLLALFDRALGRAADSPALIDERTALTYRELDQQSRQLARRFAALGLQRGDRIVLLTGNCVEFGIVALAAWRLGLIIAPLNPRNVRDEVAFVLNQCQARALVYEEWLADRCPQPGQAPTCTQVLEARTLIDSAQAADPGQAHAGQADASAEATTRGTTGIDSHAGLPQSIAEEAVAVLLYTSGTTGRPKGAMLTHLNIVHSVMHFVDTMSLRDGEERSLLAVPISHVTGLVAVWLSMVAVAGSVSMIRDFKAPLFLSTMVSRAITHTIVVPAIYNLLLRDPQFGQCDLSHWRIGGYGGAPMPEATITALASALPGLGLMNAYGATETTSPVTLMPAAEQRAHLDSVGRLLPCAEVRVVDDDGHDVAPGESGELWIAGPMVVPGYWDNPQATAREFADGFWHSGDIGSIDANGYVRVFDRKKDMINRGGYKVYSAEVESVLHAHPAVLEAAVLGEPDPVLGERTRAVIVIKPGEEADAAELRAHCGRHLADYKVPDFVESRDQPLPRNPNGKVLKRELRGAGKV